MTKRERIRYNQGMTRVILKAGYSLHTERTRKELYLAALKELSAEDVRKAFTRKRQKEPQYHSYMVHLLEQYGLNPRRQAS